MLFNRRKHFLFLSIALLFIASVVVGGFVLVAQDMSTIVFALAGSPPGFDPLAAADSRVDTPSINLYNALIQYLPGVTEWEMELAEGIDSSRRRLELYLHAST